MRFQLPVACKYVAAALAAPDSRFYTLEEFVRVTNYPIDEFTVNNFFHNLIDDTNIYISEQILDYCGYQGKLIKKKNSFMLTLQANFKEESDYWIYNNNSYNSHYKNLSDQEIKNQELKNPALMIEEKYSSSNDKALISSMFPNPNKFIGVNGKNQTTHVITTVECFREFVMCLRTERGGDVRRFYLGLEKLIKVYGTYQSLYLLSECNTQNKLANDTLIELRISNKESRNLNKKLQISNEEAKIANEEAKIENEESRNIRKELQISNEKLQEDTEEIVSSREDAEATNDVIIDKMNLISRKLGVAVVDRVIQPDDCKKQETFILFRLNDPDCTKSHLAIRAQYSGVKRAEATVLKAHPNAKKILSIEATPNAKVLFANIREKIREPTYTNRYITLPETMTEKQFLIRVKKVYAARSIVKVADIAKE